MEGKREAIRFANWDSAAALTMALFINAAILIVAAAVFHRSGHTEVAEIEDAYRLLSPLLGVGGASAIFAIALLASGQNSTLTGTLAGQVVMEGFLHIRLPQWKRRLITRLTAIIPTVIVVALYGEHGTAKLLIFSQVILSMQLSFAVFPLVAFTSDRRKMGQFVNATWLKGLAWAVAIVIAGLNAWLLSRYFGESEEARCLPTSTRCRVWFSRPNPRMLVSALNRHPNFYFAFTRHRIEAGIVQLEHGSVAGLGFGTRKPIVPDRLAGQPNIGDVAPMREDRIVLGGNVDHGKRS